MTFDLALKEKLDVVREKKECSDTSKSSYFSTQAFCSFVLPQQQQQLLWPRLWFSERLLWQVSRSLTMDECFTLTHSANLCCLFMLCCLFSSSCLKMSLKNGYECYLIRKSSNASLLPLLCSHIQHRVCLFIFKKKCKTSCLITECTRTRPVSLLLLPHCHGLWSRRNARGSALVEEAAGGPKAAFPLHPRAVKGLPHPEQVSRLPGPCSCLELQHNSILS